MGQAYAATHRPERRRDHHPALPPAGIRDVLGEDEVARVLDGVNRSHVTGRRDYAVLVLAARFGMRPWDIGQLRLDDIHWREGVIAIRQAKTGGPLALPLLPDVLAALVAYFATDAPRLSIARCSFATVHRLSPSRRVTVCRRSCGAPSAVRDSMTGLVAAVSTCSGIRSRPGCWQRAVR